MSEKLRANTDGLRSEAPKFPEFGDALGRALRDLRGSIEGEGRCWGGDKPGKAFEQNYKPGNAGADQELTHLEELVTLMHQIGAHVVNTANAIDWRDFENKNTIGGLVT